MDVYDVSNITDTKENVIKKWTVRQRIKASKYRVLYKILECEVSILSAKLPFLEENQIKCIALNWLGIPTIIGRIPNAQTIEYLVPAEKKKKVMTMIQLLFSKRKASTSKREQNLFSELSEMILKTCTGLISPKNCTSCEQLPNYSRNTTLGIETITPEENTTSNSSMVLTAINDRHEEQINSLPKECCSPETEGTSKESLFQKPENKMDHKRKRRLFWGPGCVLSEKRRKEGFKNTNRDSLDYSGISEGSIQMQCDEMLEAVIETGITRETMLTEDASDSENMITRTSAKSMSPTVYKCKGIPPVNPSNLNAKQNFTVQKSVVVHGATVSKEQCRTSDIQVLGITKQHLVPHSTGNNLLQNSELHLVQEISKERTNERKTGADLMLVNKPSTKNTAAIVQINKLPSQNKYNVSGINHVGSEKHGKAESTHENKSIVSNETVITEVESEELMLVQNEEIKETAIIATVQLASTADSSGNQMLQNEHISSSDSLMESEEVVHSQTTSNDTFTQCVSHSVENCDGNMMPRKLNSGKVKKHLKISATALLRVEREGPLVTTPDRGEVSSEKGSKEQNTPVEIRESSHDLCAALSPTPSSKAISQELGHQSPIEYLSLEPYSSEQESQDKESPEKTVCWEDGATDETPIAMTQNVDLLVDLFNPVISATNQSARTCEAGEPPDDETILSLDAL